MKPNRAPRTFLNNEQKEFIETNYKEMTIKQMANAIGARDSTVYHYVFSKRLDFKRVEHKMKIDKIFAPGCFNPHERENWLV